MDWKTIVSTVAPWIGTALVGPLGGMAVSAIGDALGLEDKTLESVKQAVMGASPDQLLALKKADQDFAAHMQELGFSHIEKLAELEVKDRDSARNREIQTRDSANKWIALFVIAVWALINILVFALDLPPEKEMIIARILGTLDAALMVVLYYYFGGSKGSDRKTDIMEKQIQSK